MSVARSLERRLERLIEGVAGRMFSGRLHPSELAGKLAREADFARFDHPTGPATANLFVVRAHPKDLAEETGALERMLADELTAYTAEEGLRLEGPVVVQIEAAPEAIPGSVTCHVEVLPGPPVPWASLVSKTETLEVGRNRAVLGRSPDADVVVAHDDVSRHHALVHRYQGRAFVRDLGSSNGTWVDGTRVGAEPVPIEAGSFLGLGSHRYRFMPH